jgi:hypothetical protein
MAYSRQQSILCIAMSQVTFPRNYKIDFIIRLLLDERMG